ncbi:MAG: hypothetical protein JWR16_2927 [Nevskia sp.]|nr:hypothetical protein [Nevskia sp.]
MKADLAAALPNAVVAEFITEVMTHESLQRYAKASGDLNPLHLDPAFARQAGFDDVIVHGMLGMAALGRLLTEHFPASTIRTFNARFGAIIPVNRALHCRALLDQRGDTLLTLTLEARIAGTDTIAVSGNASIALGASD